MDIKTNEAGAVEGEHILKQGFEVFDTIEGNDMGQMSWSIPQYRNHKCTITGGYWSWKVSDLKGKELIRCWWNTNEEFNQTMKEFDLL